MRATRQERGADGAALSPPQPYISLVGCMDPITGTTASKRHAQPASLHPHRPPRSPCRLYDSGQAWERRQAMRRALSRGDASFPVRCRTDTGRRSAYKWYAIVPPTREGRGEIIELPLRSPMKLTTLIPAGDHIRPALCCASFRACTSRSGRSHYRHGRPRLGACAEDRQARPHRHAHR